VANDRALYTLLRRIVAQETKYLRTYIGHVLNNQDSLSKGRVQVELAALGWMGADQAPWCWPRDKHGMSVPVVDEWVEVSFINGDPSLPVYRGLAAEIQGNVAKAYNGTTTRHVLFSDPDDKVEMVFDAVANLLTIGKTSPKAAARKDDPTGADATTDPTNIPLIMALAAMFGFTLSPPIVGKITGGSTQVEVGDT